ncbi:hypothetical protein PUR_02990 [Paenibacillus sp. URB8-2]|nr:hypothetical protein PUR_02990 [Paenibacillus sp. URB8-2]
MSILQITKDGVFGEGSHEFGGSYVPEQLGRALDKLSEAFEKYKDDQAFEMELQYYVCRASQPTLFC